MFWKNAFFTGLYFVLSALNKMAVRLLHESSSFECDYLAKKHHFHLFWLSLKQEVNGSRPSFYNAVNLKLFTKTINITNQVFNEIYTYLQRAVCLSVQCLHKVFETGSTVLLLHIVLKQSNIELNIVWIWIK